MDAGEARVKIRDTLGAPHTVSGLTIRGICTYLRLEQQRDCKNSQEFNYDFTFHQTAATHNFMTPAQRHHSQGMSLYGSGDYRRAIEEFSQTIELDPQYAEAYYIRGLSYANLGQYERAIEDYDKAIELEPQFAQAYASRASSYFLLKQDKRAIEDYDEAIKIDPNDGYAHYWRGQAHSQLGNSAQSTKDLAKAEELGYEPD